MECNDCKFYDVMGGICTKLDIFVNGDEFACFLFVQKTDVKVSNG